MTKTSASLTARGNRRGFLKTGSMAAALSAVSLTPRPVDSAPKAIHIGVAGGGFGCSFQWHEHPDCVVEAVSDLRPERRERLMKTYSCSKAYHSLEEMVKDPAVDAVAIFTGAPDHVRHVELAMKHGKHVISAVPACVGSLDEAERLLDVVKTTGLIYMMAETSYYQQKTITARKMFQEGRFGDLFYCESEYQHPGLEVLFFENGERTWRHGYPPMNYPTHCTAHMVSVTGERLTEVVCHGWGDDDPILQDNAYNNPFWNESAMFRTGKGHAFRVNVWWKGAHRGCERAQWIGDRMSFYDAHPNGMGPVIIRTGGQVEKDDAGFERALPEYETIEIPQWWKTDMLPEPLRHDSGHEGSHPFITHEFIDALSHDRLPTVNVYEALAYTVPGIVAHQSALRKGEWMKIPQYS
ncbi:MAG: twin-arginine translocation signal domain-containing protein [bacterium]|nr:twin-arginine translocation signal domain-containing protein [bacterium]